MSTNTNTNIFSNDWPRVLVIGTAGRGSDMHRLSLPMYRKMYGRLQHKTQNLKPFILVSGGAAWSDHLAVLALKHEMEGVAGLELFLPAEFCMEKKEFRGSRDAGVSNYYHRRMSKQVGWNTLEDIAWAIQSPKVKVTVGRGFFHRNRMMAERADYVIAFTFGERTTTFPHKTFGCLAGLKDGGTKYTWNQVVAPKGMCHYNLNEF